MFTTPPSVETKTLVFAGTVTVVVIPGMSVKPEAGVIVTLLVL